MLLGLLVLLSSQELLETTDKKLPGVHRRLDGLFRCIPNSHALDKERWKWDKRQEGRRERGAQGRGESEN